MEYISNSSLIQFIYFVVQIKLISSIISTVYNTHNITIWNMKLINYDDKNWNERECINENILHLCATAKCCNMRMSIELN